MRSYVRQNGRWGSACQSMAVDFSPLVLLSAGEFSFSFKNGGSMVSRLAEVLKDDSGFILRGGWAVGFLVFMFIMAIIGQVSWEGFGILLLASLVLTGLRSIFSR